MTELPGVRRVEFIMGMPIVVDVRHDEAEAEIEATYDWFRHVDEVFSTYKEDSEISRVNRGELHRRDCTDEMRFILDRCEELTELTDGFFDMRATPDRSLDPSGLVKGWSVDRAADMLLAAGLTNFAVSAGGDMRLSGSSIPLSATRSRWSSPRTILRSQRRGRTSVAITLSTRTQEPLHVLCCR